MDVLPVPRHVAVIMDGNGRWAKMRQKPRVFGHRQGRNSVEKTIRAAADAGVETLSLFAFSTENWSRPSTEIGLIMELIQRSIVDEAETLCRQDIRLRFLGRRDKLSASLQENLQWSEALTKNCQRMQVIFAIDYSGHWGILETVRHLAKQVSAGTLSAEQIDEAVFEAARPMPDLPPVDLLIRSSGELRISNFHLWEIAYAELFFTDTLWPDFDESLFREAICAYQARERRYGGLLPQNTEEKLEEK